MLWDMKVWECWETIFRRNLRNFEAKLWRHLVKVLKVPWCFWKSPERFLKALRDFWNHWETFENCERLLKSSEKRLKALRDFWKLWKAFESTEKFLKALWDFWKLWNNFESCVRLLKAVRCFRELWETLKMLWEAFEGSEWLWKSFKTCLKALKDFWKH